MASKRKPKAKLPKAVEAWARLGPTGEIHPWNVWSTKGLAEGLGNRSVRVRIVPIARKRRRVGK